MTPLQRRTLTIAAIGLGVLVYRHPKVRAALGLPKVSLPERLARSLHIPEDSLTEEKVPEQVKAPIIT